MRVKTHFLRHLLCVLVALLPIAWTNAQNGKVAMFQDGPNATVFNGTVPSFYLSPAEVQSSGVEIEMMLVDLNSSSVDEFGIIWSDKGRPDYYDNKGRYAFPMPMTEGAHSYLIKGLQQNMTYFAYGYVVIDGVMFISNEILFENSMLAMGMKRSAARNANAITGCGTIYGETIFLDEDNENNAGTGTADNDFGKKEYSIGNGESNHPIEFNLFTNKDALMDGVLAINAYDVDEDDFDSANGVPEIDEVYFNGKMVGHLSGNNETWNTTTFRIPKENIVKGKNSVRILVSQPYNGKPTSYWYVKVTSAQLLINGGVGDKGSIGELTINSAEKNGSIVNVKVAADIKVCELTSFLVETNLISPDNSNVYTTKTTFTASSDIIDKELKLELPLGSMTGTYTANFYLFDNTAGKMLHSASINIEHTQNIGVNPLVVAITPSTELETTDPVILTCKAKSVVPSQASITGVQAPGASAHNGKSEALYTATRNGTYTFKVYYMENGNEKTKDFSYTVSNIVLKSQTITWQQDFTNIKVGEPVTLAATASSNLPVIYSMDANDYATLTNNVLLFKKAGKSVKVEASQEGGSGYKPAEPVSISISSKRGIQENVTFPEIKEPAVGKDITLPRYTSDGREIIYTVTPTDAAVITKNGNDVIIAPSKGGDIVIKATIAQTDDYEKIEKEFPIKASKATQTLTWTQDLSALQVNVPVELTAKSSISSLIVTYESSNASVATITEGNKLTMLKANTEVTITAKQAGDASYNAAANVSLKAKATSKGAHTITWDATYTNVKVGDPVELPALKSSLNVDATYNSQDEKIATISSVDGKTLLTFLQCNKIVTVTATAAGNDDYEAASQVKQITATVKGDTPNVDFPEIGGGGQGGQGDKPTVGGVYEYPAKTADGRTINYSIVPTDAGTIERKDAEDKVLITITKSGNVKVVATIEATSDYDKVEKEFPIVVEKADQTITWNQDLSALQVNVPVELTAKSSIAALAVTYESSDVNIATITEGNKLTMLKANTEVTITAKQIGNTNYNAATNVALKAKATSKGAHTITWNAAYTNVKVGEAIELPALTSSQNVTVTYESSNSEIAKITIIDGKSFLTFLQYDKIATITAKAAGNADYEAASASKQITATVKGDTPNVDFPEIGGGSGQGGSDDKPFVGGTYEYPAKTADGRTINYSIDPTDAGTIDRKDAEGKVMITITKAGNVVIVATIEATPDYDEVEKEFPIAVEKGEQTLTWNQDLSSLQVNVPVELTATSNIVALTVTYESSDVNIATITDGNKLTMLKANKEVTITAKQAGNENYNVATDVEKTLIANQKGIPSIDADYPQIEEGEKAPKVGETLEFPAKTTDGRDIVYTIVPEEAGTQRTENDITYIEITQVGDVTITATIIGDDDYENAEKEFPITTQKGNHTLAWEQVIEEITVGDKLQLTASVTSDTEITYTISNPDLGVVTADNCLVPVKEGTITLNAIAKENANYLASNDIDKTIVIKPLVIEDDKDLGDITIPDESWEEIVITVAEEGNMTLTENENGEKSIKELVINQKDETVGTVYTEATANVYPETLTLNATFTPGKWHFISIPFDVNLSNLDTRINEDYVIAYYDAEQRAQNKRDNWKMMENAATLEAGKGYLIRTLKDNVVLKFSTNEKEVIKNTLTSEDVNQTLVYADNDGKATVYNAGWNFIGVPYLSEYLAEPSDKILYVYDEELQNFVVVSKDMEQSSMKLRPWSAFLLQSASTEDAMMFEGINRISGKNRSMAHAVNESSSVSDRYVFELRKGDKVDRNVIVLNDEAGEGYVINEDAAKFFSLDKNMPQLYSLAGEGAVALNKLPMVNDKATVNMIAKASGEGEYELSLIEKPEDSSNILLLVNGNQQKMSEGESYALGSSNSEHQFKVLFSKSPVHVGNGVLSGVSLCMIDNRLYVDGLEIGAKVQVTSTSGSVLYMETAMEAEVSCPLSENGVYLVTISENGKTEVFKIVR